MSAAVRQKFASYSGPCLHCVILRAIDAHQWVGDVSRRERAQIVANDLTQALAETLLAYDNDPVWAEQFVVESAQYHIAAALDRLKKTGRVREPLTRKQHRGEGR